MQRVRVGVVGCGEVTQLLHLPGLAQLTDRFAVTAACDLHDDVLQAVARRWDIPARHRDYAEIVARSDVDAVLVATAHAAHAEVTLAALAAGKHVLVEKPMCPTLREADAIVEVQRRTGLVVQVGYMRRYASAFLDARAVIPPLADIRLARVHAVIGQNALFIRGTSSVVRPAESAGAVQGSVGVDPRLETLIAEAVGDAPPEIHRAYGLLLGLSSHDLSLMRDLLGRPRRVLYAAVRREGMYLSAAFDYGDFVCQFETGIDDIPRFDSHIEVFGRERTVHVQYDTPYVRNLPIRLSVIEANGRGGVIRRDEHPSWGDPFVAEWTAFHESVTSGAPTRTPASDFREDLELFAEMARLMAAERRSAGSRSTGGSA